MKFTTTLQMAHELGVNATCMNSAKISNFFFLNLEKQRRSQNTVKKLVADNKEIADQTYILEHIREFYKTLFNTWEQKTVIEMETFSVMLIFRNSQHTKACKVINLQVAMD